MEQEPVNDGQEMLTLEEAVQFLGTSRPTLYRLLGQGDLKGLKVGRQWRFRRADLVAYLERGERAAEDPEVIRLAYGIVQQAIQERASDIHLEPRQENVLVRHRIDGLLHEARTVPKDKQQPLVMRFKVMADMNTVERQVPQDGRIPVRHEGKEFDLRVATVPSLYGEAITVRILDTSARLIGLDTLGLEPEDRAKIEEFLHQPNGLILNCGPAGSGRTTLLYSCLQAVANAQKKTITVEEPVETPLSSVTQIPVNKSVGLTFAAGLRSIMRQDPDIIMAGRLSDLETVHLAMEASLTGHLVLATLAGAVDAPGALARLEELGAESHLVPATVMAIIGERLCRRICGNCKTAYTAPAGELARFGFDVADPAQAVTLYRGTGCEQCRHRGYRGRIGLFEILTMTQEVADLLLGHAPLEDVVAAAQAQGMTTLRQDGLRKVLAGLTTPDEALRVLFVAGVS